MQLRERGCRGPRGAAAPGQGRQEAGAPGPTTTPKPAAKGAVAAADTAAAPPPPVTVPSGTAVVGAARISGTRPRPPCMGEAAKRHPRRDLVVDGRRVAGRRSAARHDHRGHLGQPEDRCGAGAQDRLHPAGRSRTVGPLRSRCARNTERCQSEKGRDTAKIVGGTAAGAVIGHQVSHDKGTVIGGVIGAARGAIAASKTGTEVEIAAGSVVPATLRASFEYDGPVTDTGGRRLTRPSDPARSRGSARASAPPRRASCPCGARSPPPGRRRSCPPRSSAPPGARSTSR